MDKEDNLAYNYFRDYDPGIGRYVRSDPIGLRGGSNTYAYARGNPLRYTDPSGRFGLAGIGIGVFAGGAAGYIAGGWQGAVVGAVAGGVVGLAAPWLSAAAGSAAGGGLGGMIASAGTFVAVNGVAGGAGAVAANQWTGQPLAHDLGWGIGIGVLAPLASAEAFFVGAGGVEALGVASGVEAGFSGVTGLFSIFGAAIDPNSEHGFAHSTQGIAQCRPHE